MSLLSFLKWPKVWYPFCHIIFCPSPPLQPPSPNPTPVYPPSVKLILDFWLLFKNTADIVQNYSRSNPQFLTFDTSGMLVCKINIYHCFWMKLFIDEVIVNIQTATAGLKKKKEGVCHCCSHLNLCCLPTPSIDMELDVTTCLHGTLKIRVVGKSGVSGLLANACKCQWACLDKRSPQVFWSTCLLLSSTVILEQSTLLSPTLCFHGII